jgi:hypothetical protein
VEDQLEYIPVTPAGADPAEDPKKVPSPNVKIPPSEAPSQ